MEMESCKLFIGGISWETSEDRLRDYFHSFGEVLEAVIMKDRATGRARGFGFVVFADPNVAERVVLLKHIIDGKIVSFLLLYTNIHCFQFQQSSCLLASF
jgi:RNA-binding protein Musashi